MFIYSSPLIISNISLQEKRKQMEDALALKIQQGAIMGIKKSSLFLPCSWIYPYLLCPIFPMSDLEQRLPQMLCWNINKVNSQCQGWNSPHHIWDQEMPRAVAREEFALIMATGFWVWRGVTSFKNCDVMELDCHVCISPICYQKPSDRHNGNPF